MRRAAPEGGVGSVKCAAPEGGVGSRKREMWGARGRRRKRETNVRRPREASGVGNVYGGLAELRRGIRGEEASNVWEPRERNLRIN